MSIENNNIKNQDHLFTYSISCGPFKLQGQGNLDNDLSKLDKIVSYLDKPDQVQNKEGMEKIFAFLKQTQSKLSVRLSRMWNLVFGDHNWYNESRVRKIVKVYIKQRSKGQVPNHSKKVIAAFDALAAIKKGNSTYAEGIKRDSLNEHQAIDTLKAAFDKMPEMPEVKAMVTKTAQTLGAIGIIALQSYFKSALLKGVANSSYPLIGLQVLSFASDLAQAASKDLKVELPTLPEPKKTRPRSRSIS